MFKVDIATDKAAKTDGRTGRRTDRLVVTGTQLNDQTFFKAGAATDKVAKAQMVGRTDRQTDRRIGSLPATQTGHGHTIKRHETLCWWWWCTARGLDD